MAKEIMEILESSEVITGVLEKIDILVEKANESILTIQVNTSKEQIEEEVVVIGAK